MDKKTEQMVKRIISNSRYGTGKVKIKSAVRTRDIIPEREFNALVQEIAQNIFEQAGGMKGVKVSPREARNMLGDLIDDIREIFEDHVFDLLVDRAEDFIDETVE